ncbi:ribosomal protein 60S [Basidiobolus meristosporus CBS 931.73]|uniref:Ribosomal protein 60S n=1 Tax=Basidiobolus meristosporus CBS 931.73 TaxID=1314790 RepID=A0A1Y1ZB16_9FUNG|nr:ribosomal protein 60S [Basidiobolus meristosporus CBS 931.73]|eukprot:ORY07471.1 ribosomal protein 60S [Basidiobolus meristosporus CBS 931.73]
MRYIAAYLLLTLGGNEAPSASDIEKLLSSVGIETDSERVAKLISELEGKNVQELIAEGKEKLASVPTGGAAAASGAAAATGAASEAPAAEVKEEAKEESDDDMGFGLFD